MTSTERLKRRLAAGTASMLVVAIGLMATPAMAQDATPKAAASAAKADQQKCTDDQVIDAKGNCVTEQKTVEEVVVTGSRLRRTEYTSPSPIQIIKGSTKRDLGLFDMSQVLQSTTQATGLQIDNTFTSYVLDNGPGSSTIGLRGLSPERTLVLLDNHRLAPSGIGGAPTAPDINLIPSIMVDHTDILLDGASSIYGSDAVAGVVNIHLRKDIEGFEVQTNYNMPTSGGGEELTAGLLWGTKSDKGSIQIGAEFYDRKPQSFGQNPFTGDCTGHYYQDRNRKIITGDRTLGPEPSDGLNCDIFPLTNRMYIPLLWGSVYYTPGFSNTGYDGLTSGIPNFSESTQSAGLVGYIPHWVYADTDGNGTLDGAIVDFNGDGYKDFDYQDPFYNWQRSKLAQAQDFVQGQRRINIVSNGEYNLQDDNNTTLYFQGMFNRRSSTIHSAGGQFFPDVPSDNPYNPCNPNQPNGVDCVGQVVVFGDYGPLSVQPILNIRGDRDTQYVKLYQYMLLGGVRGDIGGLDKFMAGGWSYDVYGSYSYSNGKQSFWGINADRLAQSLDASFDGNGNVVCNNPSRGCVPVNLFAPNIFQEGGGTLTDAEAGFLMSNRKTETVVKQYLVDGTLQGNLFHLPWNDETVPLLLGYEFRRDSIASHSNRVTTEGLLWGYSADQGADGSRDLHEFFAETELPLIKGKKMAEEFTIHASARWTDESYYSPSMTYNVSGVYRPVTYLTFRGSYGTSYRAPNLREHFLHGSTGFSNISDPCVVPEAAQIADPHDATAPKTYDPTKDTRLKRVLDSCRATGIDPTSLGLDGAIRGSYSAERRSGGSESLSPEKSTAYTYGIVFEQPWTDRFDLRFAATYYSIDISNSISEPGGQFIIDQCLDNATQPDGTSGFCDRINRDSTGRISLLDGTFVNAAQETSKGVDLNGYYHQDFDVSGKKLGVTLDLKATYLKERLYSILGDVTDYAGMTAYPHWRADASLILKYDDFGFNWETHWIQGGKDPYSNFDPNGLSCAGTGIGCRPVYFTTNYAVHNASVTWNNGDFNVAVGVHNVFNVAPPKVDPDGVLSEHNIPLGIGYDLYGRSVFVTLGKKF